MIDALLVNADARALPLASESVDLVVTSPPYWGLRQYHGATGQIGAEEELSAYVHQMVKVFRDVRRVLKPSGVVFLNIGDSYNGSGGSTVTEAVKVASA